MIWFSKKIKSPTVNINAWLSDGEFRAIGHLDENKKWVIVEDFRWFYGENAKLINTNKILWWSPLTPVTFDEEETLCGY